MPIQKLDFSIADDFDGDQPDIDYLEVTIGQSAVSVPLAHIAVGVSEVDAVEIAFSDTLPPGEDAIVAAVVAGHGLVVARRRKMASVDERTVELITTGFSYSGQKFSLSIPAQSKMTAAHQIKDHPLFVYPVDWNSVDDNSVYSIQDADDMDAFYLTAIGTIRAYLDSGTSLKDQVRAATTIAEANAVVDPR